MDSQFPTFRKLVSGEAMLPSVWPPVTTTAQRRSLLRLIAVGLEEKLPLNELIRAWAADERGIQRERLKLLSKLLDKGVPLANAVESVSGLLREEDVLAIRFDAQSGTRTADLHEQLESSIPSSAERGFGIRDTMTYTVFIAIVAILLTTFNMIWIAPQIENILTDFSLPMPEVFQWWGQFAKFCVRYWYLFAFAVCVGIAFYFSAYPGRLIRRSVLGRFVFPLREQASADVLQKLAVASTAGRPLSGALSTLARYHFDPVLRRKLLFVRNELEQGADLWPSMAAVSLLNAPEERLLETADRIGNRPWVLAQLASVKRRRSTRRAERLSQLAMPVVVFAFGGVVLIQSLALFVPLVELVYALL
jgi:type IV pilus assembly protein PilC